MAPLAALAVSNGSLRIHCSLRSLRLALSSRCLPHSLRRRKACLLISLVQDSGAPAWPSTVARDPVSLVILSVPRLLASNSGKIDR
jgi:hypothetical protein